MQCYRPLTITDYRSRFVLACEGLASTEANEPFAVFAGQPLGITQVDEQLWQVTFMHYELGCFDRDARRVEPGPNHFTAEKVLTRSPE